MIIIVVVGLPVCLADTLKNGWSNWAETLNLGLTWLPDSNREVSKGDDNRRQGSLRLSLSKLAKNSGFRKYFGDFRRKDFSDCYETFFMFTSLQKL